MKIEKAHLKSESFNAMGKLFQFCKGGSMDVCNIVNRLIHNDLDHHLPFAQWILILCLFRGS